MRYPAFLELAPSALLPNTFNVNVVSPENEAKLDESLKRLGVFKPIVVRETEIGGYEILGGEHRWLSAKRLKMKTVPVINVGPVDDVRAKEISLADNARFGADDNAALAELLKSLPDADHLIDWLPYAETDLRAVFSSSIALEELDELDLEDGFAESDKEAAAPVAREPKTHTVMRFKVPLADAEVITALIEKVKKAYGYTAEDALTNAGDALVHLLNDRDPEAELDGE